SPRSDIGARRSKRNRLGSPMPSMLMQQGRSNGGHSFVGATSSKSPVNWNGLSPKYASSHSRFSQWPRTRRPLKPAGSLAGRGNERVTSFAKVVWGSGMTDQVSDIGNPSYSRVHSGSGEAFCVCRGAESFTTFSTHAELPSVE